MELSSEQKRAAISRIVARERAVDANPSLENMEGADCVGLRGECGMAELSAVETHTRGAGVTKLAQETVITELRV